MPLSSLEKEILLAQAARSQFLLEKIDTTKNLAELQLRADSLERRLLAVESSLSWRITSPLRKILRTSKGMFRKKIVSEKAMEETISVTVIVTTFNQPPEQIVRCLNSVIDQTFTRLRLLVWDDGSTNPETLDCLNAFSDSYDPRIYIEFNRNQGVVKARNSAADESNSKYILFLDPDDHIEITYLEKALIFAESHTGHSLAVVSTDVVVHGHKNVDIWQTEELSWPEITNHNQIAVCSLIDLQAFRSVGGFSEKMTDGFEDWELWTRLASHGYVSKRIPEPLFHYSYQESTGRDASAKEKSRELQTRIKSLNSTKKHDHVSKVERCTTSQTILDHSIVLPSGEKSSVFIFVPWLPKAGGAETFLKLLAKGFIKNGRTVCFISTLESSPSIDDYFQITPYVYELPKFLHHDSYLSFVNNLMSRTPHSIALNSGSTWLYENLNSLESLAVGKTRAYDVLYNPIGHLPNFLQNQNSFHGVIPVYRNLAKLLDEYFNVKPKVCCIPVGIDQIPVVPNGNEAKNLRVGWLGRLSSEKRPEWFLRTASAIGGGAQFSLAGDGPMRDYLRDLVPKSHGKDSEIELLGHVDSGLEYIRSLDLLINTSTIEGISVTAMEAISQGIPVISPKVGGMEDLIVDGVNGFLYDADDFQGLVSIVKNLVQTPGELARLQESTRDTLLPQEFRFEDMLQAYEDLFENKV